MHKHALLWYMKVVNPEGRVVGSDGWLPGVNDVPFAILFLLNAAVITIIFLIWLGAGSPGWPRVDGVLNLGMTLVQMSNETASELASVGALSAYFSFAFSLLWAFIYLCLLKVAAFWLIISLVVLLAVVMGSFGALLIAYALQCGSSYPPCSGEASAWSWAGGEPLKARHRAKASQNHVCCHL